jgi:hypothetical protein
MAGYSGKSLSQKLGLQERCALAVVDPPPNYRELLRPLPEGVRFCQVEEKPDLIHYFGTNRARLEKVLPILRAQMRDDAALWISWPKQSAGVPTTVTEDVVRRLALPLGLVDNKVCAVDETWSALRLVVRIVHRKATERTRI